MSSHTLSIEVPSVPYGPHHVATLVADADYYRAAAKNIRHQAARGEAFAGSNLTETVAKLCDEVAAQLEAAATAPPCATCGRPATYRLGEPTPAWCEHHGPHGRPASNALAEAWDDGFTACAGEHMKQRRDPSHPITRTNPHDTKPGGLLA
ncbi:hypothetical protein ACF1AJ_20540 [Leifsonia sp. NPDC014704]|uniref:hypothetical protein n=1 Tax=Leifsonia sp. NPDC014704 TaxID=3364123 RepID=UPI0036F4A4DE